MEAEKRSGNDAGGGTNSRQEAERKAQSMTQQAEDKAKMKLKRQS